jgi:hypothetical protein
MSEASQMSPLWWEREMRARRFMAFTERQRLKRKWMRLSRLALHDAAMRSPDGLETLADLWVAKGYLALLEDIRSGFFTAVAQPSFPERAARLQLLYLHPSMPPTRMTADWLETILGVVGSVSVAENVWRLAPLANGVGCCWTSAALAAAWCEARDIPQLLEKPGVKEKDDAAVIAAGLSYRAMGYRLSEATRLAIADYPEQFGQSSTSDVSEEARISRKIRAAERSGALRQ